MNTEELLESNRKIRVAEVPPSRCASCFGQHPDRRHIDFGAFWDGPTFPGMEVAGGGTVAIDDLVICDECLRAAATELELTDEDTRRHVLQIEGQVEELRERLLGATDYIKRLEDAAESRGKLDELFAPGARA